MKRHIWIFLIALFAMTSEMEAMNFISDGFYFIKLTKDKNRIVPKIMNELLPEDERRWYTLETDAITDTARGRIEHGFYKKLSRDSKEKVYVKIFHEDKDKDLPLTSVYDWMARNTSVSKKTLLTVNLDYETKILKSSANDVIYFWSELAIHNREYIENEGLTRAVFHKGRIFYAGHSCVRHNYTEEKKQKWFERLQNITYLNELSKLSDEEDAKPKPPVAQKRKRRRTSYRAYRK